MPAENRRAQPNSLARWRALCLCLALAGCANNSIWNAGDLVVWVEQRAVEQGCERDSVELDEWYTKTPSGNVWRGTCLDARGKVKAFGIDVDPVWKPSKPAT